MLFLLLIASAFIPLAVGFGDKPIRLPSGEIKVIPGMFMDGIRMPKEVLSGLALIGIIFVILSFYKLKPNKNKYLIAWLLWAYFITFISRYEFGFSFLFYSTLGIITITLLSMVDFSQENFTINIRKFLKAIAFMGLLQAIYAVIQILCLDQFFRVRSANMAYSLGQGSFTHRIVGCIGNPSLFSIFLAMILPVYLYLKERWAYVTFGLVLIIVALCNSTTGYFTAITSILFYLFFTLKRKWGILLINLFVVGSIISIPIYLKYCPQKFDSIFDSTGRTEIWKRGFNKWTDKDNSSTTALGAITGHGLRSWEFEIAEPEKIPDFKWREAHNDFFEIAYETGLIGIGLYLAFIFSLFKTFLTDKTKEKITMMSCLMGFVVAGLTLFPLYSSCMVLYAVIFTGLILNKKGE